VTSALERVTELLEGRGRRRRELVSPEGVPLAVDVADLGERAIAFVIDALICVVGTAVLYLLLFFLPFGSGASAIVGRAIMLFLAFLVRNFYFLYFELTWQGATPGKRGVGLRVVDRRGGPLLPAAVIARNLTREIEAFIPLGLLLSLSAQSRSGWETVALAAWMLLFTALPLLNRDRLRAGDMIAGTMVIALPKRLLLADLVEAKADYVFTEKQLGLYGAYELQVLEELLRRPDPALLREVADKICRKIEWPATLSSSEIVPFLRAFYTAQRAQLERSQLFGKARADKFSRPGAAAR